MKHLKDIALYVGFPCVAGFLGAVFFGVVGGVLATALWAYGQRVFGTTRQEALLDKLADKAGR